MSDSGHETDIDVRYRDIDAMGHVNNAVFATFLEQARVDYFRRVVGVPLTEVSSVIAHLEIDYRRPITLDDDVTVTTRVADLGESSIPMEHEIRADDEAAATAEVVLVTVDPAAREPRPIPDEWRDRVLTHGAN